MALVRAPLRLLVVGALAAGVFLSSDAAVATEVSRGDRTGRAGVAAAPVHGPPIVAQAAGLCDRSGTEQFNDVGKNAYGADYILCMRALGLSKGVGGGDFGPDRDLTRGQMASFLARLLRSQLGLTCPDGGTPFTDIAGSVHAESIACLYNLGITKGTSATRFSPGSELTAWQITLFLLRTYKKAGNSCDTRDSELIEAVDCLLGLRVIPSEGEGSSDESVDRAQMAVYVIGLWHNLKGLGLPPAPPDKGTATVTAARDTTHEPRTAFADPATDPGLWTPEGTRAGAVTVHVYYCAKEGKYTRGDLAAAVRLLNNEVAPRWKAESSNAIELTFVAGSLLSPPLGWEEPVDAWGALDACEREARGADMNDLVYPNYPESFRLEVLFLLDIEFQQQSIAGLGGRGFTVTQDGKLLYQAGGTAMAKSRGSLGESHLRTVSHELGHSILDLPHDVVSCYPDTLMTNHSCGTNSCEEREILGRWDSSVPTYGGEGLFLSCHHRRLLGWPTGGDTPPCGEYPPLSPATVTAVAGEAQVTATWTAPTFTAGAPVTGYRVELHKGTVVQEYEGGYVTEFELETVYETGPDARTHTFDVAVRDTFPYDEYFVDVSAVSGRGTSAEVSSDYVRPTPANSVQVTDLGPREFTLTWDAVPDADRYALSGFADYVDTFEYGDDGAVYGSSKRRIAESNTATLGFGDIEPDTTYTIVIEACGDWWGDCIPHARVTVTTPPAPWQPAAPPSGISVSTGQTWVEFTWDPVPEAVIYLVKAEGRIPGAHANSQDANTGTDTSHWQIPVPDSGSVVTARIESLQPDTSYTFEIYACVEKPGENGIFCGIPETVSVTTSKP